jgi:diguanylate cyclase (GGDEF)-like protein
VALQLAKTLNYLGSERIIHQAIHPGNIWLDPVTGQVTLINFEQASRLPQELESIPRLADFVGRFAYLSPEQTGRASRGIDYRTDFYSLGVVLYELLTGQLPFEPRDPTAMLYAHLTHTPRPPHRVKSTVPAMLSQVVMQLLAKAPEARYQSAKGLLHDLSRCEWFWQRQRAIPVFPLAADDRHDRFIIADRLYGREAEIDQLLMQFYRVSYHRTTAWVLISGYSGVGKTAIINQVQPQLARQRGDFCRGKFDQLNRHLPLSAVVQALRDLINQWLTQPDRQVQYWREKLRIALGDEAQVVVEILPELVALIGVPPAVPSLAGEAAGNRFNLVLLRLIRAIAQPQHPLVLFLDDLQWADAASLRLIQRLLLDPQLGNFLLIGAYRDHEVSPQHLLSLTIATLRAESVPIVDLRVLPLPAAAITQMVADTLNHALDRSAPLGAEIWRRTQGNPFFSRQFLTALYHDQLIDYDHQMGGWQYDLDRISQLSPADDVVGFMVDRLQQFPPQTRSLLSLAACIGHHFDLATLATVLGQSVTLTGQRLWPLLQLGLLVPTHQTYRFYQPADRPPQAELDPTLVTYQFLHDRVQQAAYDLIAADDRAMTHLRIGRRLRQQWQLQLGVSSIVAAFDDSMSPRLSVTPQCDRQFLEIVNQLNHGMRLIESPAERWELAALNGIAARRALAATAYQTALTWATTGITLLGQAGWQSDYPLQLKLHELAAETAYLCGEFHQTQACVAAVQRHGRSRLDTIRVCDIQIKAHMAAGAPQAAVQFGLQTLRQLGLRLPTHPRKWQAGLTLWQTQLWLRCHSPRQFGQLPLMTDAHAIAVAQILQPLAYIAVMAQPYLMPTYILTSLQLARKFGNSVNLAYAYTSYGMLCSSVYGDFNAGYQWAQLALDALDRCPDPAAAPRIQVALAMAINHWQMPFRQVAAAMPPVYQACLETGQLEMAAWALHTHAYNQFFAGGNLATLAKQLDEYAETVRQFNQLAVLRFINTTQYGIALWRGDAARLMNPLGWPYDLDQCLVEALAVKNWTEVFVLYLCRSLKHTIAGEPARAYVDLQNAYPYLNTVGSLAHLPAFHYQMALGAAAYADTVGPQQQRAIRRTLKRSVNYLQTAARQCPANYASKFYLAQAEWYRLKGDRAAAIVAYDRAIALAQDHQMLSDKAQANELAGRFYAQWQQPTIAQVYLIQAHHAYTQWGAIAKVDALLRTYPDLLVALQPPEPAMVRFAAAVASAMPEPEVRPLQSAMQAARSLSSHRHLTPLLEDLMRTLLQEAMADRGVLLLATTNEVQQPWYAPSAQGDGRWWIYLDTRDRQFPTVLNPPITLSPQTEPNHLPQGLVQYIEHTQEMVIRNADPGDVFEDQSQSLIGLPIAREQRLLGIVYLAYDPMAGGLSDDRVALLQLLCEQAAIAIDNIQIHQRQKDYTQRLEQSQTAMLQTQSNFLDEMLHDPLTGRWNRTWVTNRLMWWLQYNRWHPPRFGAVLLMDVDRFQAINQQFGSIVGDRLLMAVADRLQSCVRSPDQVGRLGSDEFVILLESGADVEDAIALAESILAQFQLSFTIGLAEIHCDLRLGIATSLRAVHHPEDWLRAAERALGEAKARQLGYWVLG